MALLNENGYKRPTYQELLDAQISRAKVLFGEDIDTSELTVLGKFMRLNVYDIAVLHEELENVYYARFPATASGVSLDRLCRFVGITRNSAKSAYHEVKITGVAEKTIAAGELVLAAEDNTLFTLAEDCYLEIDYPTLNETGELIGKGVGLFVCNEPGTVGNVSLGMINRVFQPNINVAAIEHIDIKSLGKEIESDVALRYRFGKTVAGIGCGTINSLYSVLWSLEGVEGVSIAENDTYANDEAGRPPKSFECYVLGGNDNEIAEAIFSKTPIGIKTISTSEDINRVEIMVEDEAGNKHTVSFSRPKEYYIYMLVSVAIDSNFDINNGENEIKNNLIEYLATLSNGDDVIYSNLFSIIHKTHGVVSVSIGLSTVSLTNEDNINVDENTVLKKEDVIVPYDAVARATTDTIIVGVEDYVDR